MYTHIAIAQGTDPAEVEVKEITGLKDLRTFWFRADGMHLSVSVRRETLIQMQETLAKAVENWTDA